MHDLIKITSRKSTTKIITFYFRIPKLAEYSSGVYKDDGGRLILELDTVGTLGKKPAVKYAFAFKRNLYEEVSLTFEFNEEERAKECINVVS